MSLSLRQLQAFVLAHDSGSLSGAAQVMDITPSAASLLLKQFEQGLGMVVFERTPRGLKLTEDGQSVLPLVRQVVAGTERLGQLARARHALPQARLRLAATPAMARTLLPPVMRKFAALHPHVLMSLDDGPASQLATAVAQGEIDLALATLSGDVPESVMVERLLRDSLCLVCRPDDALAARTSLDWTELQGAALVMVGAGNGVRERLDQALNEQRVSVRTAFEVHQLGTALSLVEQGLGLAVLPSFLLSFTPTAAVVARPLQPPFTRDISMLWRDGTVPLPAVQTFAELLRSELGD
jgi:DNA-binding transcriptional LysR family regulator